MKVTTERLPDSQLLLQIEVEPEVVERSLEEAYRRLVNRANVPGFRKGKTPRAMLERYLGKEALLDDALDHLVPKLYEQAIEENGIDAIALPKVEITQRDPVAFKATVPLRPTVELGDYHSLYMSPEEVDVPGEQVDSVLEQIRREVAPWEPVARPVQEGDLVTIDTVAHQGGEPAGNSSNVAYLVEDKAGTPLPGFAAALCGMRPGEEKEFEIPVPPDHPEAGFAGKTYSFKVKLQEVKERRLPRIDDAFAQSLGPDTQTLLALRAKIRKGLEDNARSAIMARFREEVVEAVVQAAKVEFPPILLERELDYLVDEQRDELSRMKLSMEAYLARLGKSEAALREELRPLAQERIRRRLVVAKVASEEGIAVDERETAAEVEKILETAGEEKERLRANLDKPGARATLRHLLQVEKTIDRLVEIATAKKAEETTTAEEGSRGEEAEPEASAERTSTDEQSGE